MSAAPQLRGSAVSAEEKLRRRRVILRVTWLGFAANFALTIFKFVFGYLGHSHALVADAFHSMTDLVTDLAIIFGIKYWDAPADAAHPYGHKRIEAIVTAFIGFSLAFVAVGIFYDSADALLNSRSVKPEWSTLIVALVSIFVKEWLFRWMKKVGSTLDSSAVVANAWHHRSDAFASIPVSIAIGVSIIAPGWSCVDNIGAMLVALLIVYASWAIVKPAIFELSDGGASFEVIKDIRASVAAVPEVKSVHGIRTRKHGSEIYIDLHIMVDESLTVRQGHDIARIVRRKALDDVPCTADVLVHVEPFEEDHLKT